MNYPGIEEIKWDTKRELMDMLIDPVFTLTYSQLNYVVYGFVLTLAVFIALLVWMLAKDKE